MVLACLVRRPNVIVTREELQLAVWPSGTWVEFDYSLNTAINRIRRTLGDTAAQPRFVETVPKRGYRFIAPVEFLLPIAENGPGQGPVLAPMPGEAAVASPGAVPSAPAPPAVRPRFRWPMMLAAATGVILAGGGFYIASRATAQRPPAGSQVVRSTIVLPQGHRVGALAISPQGDQIVYETGGAGHGTLYCRYLDSDGSRALSGGEVGFLPFFSPDGKEVGFYTVSTLRIAGAAGFRDIAQIPPEYDRRSAFWSDDGWIYFTTLRDGKSAIWRVLPAGGSVQPVLEMERTARGIAYGFAQQTVRGGDALLYSTVLGPRRRSISWLDRKTGGKQTIVERGMGGNVLSSGHFLYFWRGSLLAAPFEESSMRMKGSPVEVLNEVNEHGWVGALAAVSASGTLVYSKRNPLPQRTLAWLTPSGQYTKVDVPAAAWEQASVSPDGQRLALIRREDAYRRSLWSYELRTGGWTRLLGTDLLMRAVWSPDSKAVVAGFEHENGDFVNLYRIPIAGPRSMERLTEQPNFGQFPVAWSAAANAILYMEGVHPDTKGDIFALPLTGERRPKLLVNGPGWDNSPSFAPDGKRFVYASERNGKVDVFIQDYAGGSTPVQVSRKGGREPLWAPDGKRIYFMDERRHLMEAGIGPNGAPGEPKELIAEGFTETPDIWTRGYSIAPDGRLLVIRAPREPEASNSQISVVVNWFEELKRLAPVL